MPPLDGTLIRRLAGPDDGTGLNDAREWWYDPAPTARTVGLYFIYGTADFADVDLDPAFLIDRWCLAPGLPPFTERQVRHNGGTNTVNYTDVDGAGDCAVSCTLGLVLVAAAGADGRADVTATATAAVGAVLFSLDGFDTAGLPPAPAGGAAYTWPELRTGTYTVAVRETRPGGCTATASITLTSPRSPRYEHTFKTCTGTTARLRIQERDYTGPVTPALGQPAPVLLDWPGAANGHLFDQLLRGSSCEMALLRETASEFRPLFSGDERLHLVEYAEDDVLLWKGYLLPEQYDSPFLAPPTEIAFQATDGLGTLTGRPFAGPAGERLRGDWPLLRILQYCLGKLELDLPLRTLLTLYPSTATLGAAALTQARVDVGQYRDEKDQPWDCARVLDELTKSFQARLYQWAGAWHLERLTELRTGPVTYAVFAPDGTRAADVTATALQEIDPTGPLFWLTEAQRQLARGAVSTITATAEPGEPANLIAFARPRNTDLPGPYPAAWRGSTSTPGIPYTQLVFAGRDKPPLLRLVGTIGAAYAANPLLAPWVELPATGAISFVSPSNPNGSHGALRLSFRIQAYGNAPPTPTYPNPTRLPFAVQIGTQWLRPSGAGLSPTPVILAAIALPDGKAIAYQASFLVGITGAQPVRLRFYAPVGGRAATTVDLSELTLGYDNFETERAEDQPYTDTYLTDTRQLVSRTDTATLFHVDTPNARFAGTLLDGASQPTQGWFEAGTPGQVRELGDWFVTARYLLQRRAAQVLTGTLYGPLGGPGALITDPSEESPAVYPLTACTYNPADHTWQVRGVQHLQLIAPPETLPDGAIYHENDAAWQSEDGFILTYEDAPAH